MDCGSEWKLSPSSENIANFVSIPTNIDISSCRNPKILSHSSFEFTFGASIISNDSGIPLTNSSSADSCTSNCKLQICESDGDVSQLESLSNSFESGMNGEHFNTLKKGPFVHIEPPPEFQDSPRNTLSRLNFLISNNGNNNNNNSSIETSDQIIPIVRWSSQNSFPHIQDEQMFSNHSNEFNKYSYASDSFLSEQKENIYDEPTTDILNDFDKNFLNVGNGGRGGVKQNFENRNKKGTKKSISTTQQKFNPAALSEIHDYDIYYGLKRNYNYDLFQQRSRRLYSPLLHNAGNLCNSNRPNSRNSLTSRLSSSHNSLNVNKPDDSIFITQAMSHDALLSREISDFYNVPVDSDIYASPIDMIKPETEYSNRTENEKIAGKRLKTYNKYNKQQKKKRNYYAKATNNINENTIKTKHQNAIEPLHLTLEEVKQFYHTIYSDNEIQINNNKKKVKKEIFNQESVRSESFDNSISSTLNRKNSVTITTTNTTTSTTTNSDNNIKNNVNSTKKAQFSISFNIREKFCSIFRFRKNNRLKNSIANSSEYVRNETETSSSNNNRRKEKIQFRALPPLPNKNDGGANDSEKLNSNKKEKRKNAINTSVQFTSSIEKVKDYGWYWGPLSSEAAEKVLSNEPDGSFIVRDSSDDHYIFSLSFKLNNSVRHVRIEQDQGTFSFGSYAKFKSQTITEFIEKAVEHSRSGRYLFFLHRRPEHGPMRVQLTNPVSRFKHVQSLQHMCRFVILKTVVRKDLIEILPLPRRLLDYLSYKHCYSEQIENDSSHSKDSGEES